MFIKRLILLLLFAVFVFLAVPQFSNLLVLWRDYHAISRYAALYNENEPNKNYFAGRIPEYIAEQDPEAACIASYMLKSQSIYDSGNDAASGAIQYPNNEFFWGRLAESLSSHEMQYDPQIIQLIADKLIELHPDNADYCILKAFAALQNRNGNDINEVLPPIRQAAQCKNFENPFELYHQRVMAIAEKARFSSLENSFLQVAFRLNYPAYRFSEDLLSIARMKFNDSRIDEGIAISDALNSLLYSNGSKYLSVFPYSWQNGFSGYSTPAFMELRDVNVSKERRDYDHLLLASAAQSYYVPPQRQPADNYLFRHYVLAFPLLIHCGRMVFVIAVIVALIICTRRKTSHQLYAPVGIWNGCLFAFGCLLYFIASNLHHWITYNSCCGLHLTYVTVLTSGEECRASLFSRPLETLIGLLITFIPLIILLVINKIKWLKRILYSSRIHIALKIVFSVIFTAMLLLCSWQIIDIFRGYFFSDIDLLDLAAYLFICLFFPIMACVWVRPSARGKIISIVLFTIFWSLAANILITPYLWWLPFAGFLLTILIFIFWDESKGFWSQYVRIFRDQQTAARAIAVLIPAAIIYLLIIPVTVPWTMRAKENDQFFSKSHTTSYHLFPPPTQETYQNIIKSFSDDKPSLPLVNRLAVLKPDDLKSVLSGLKEQIKDNSKKAEEKRNSEMRGMPGMWSGTNYNSEKIDLRELLHICPRSSAAVIRDFIADPNEISILIERGLLGDMSARQPLLDALAGKYDPNAHFHYPYDTIQTAAVVKALIPISEPNEAANRIITCIKKNFAEGGNNLSSMPGIPGSMPGGGNINGMPKCQRIPDNGELLSSVKLLPSPQAGWVLTAYLDECESMPERFTKEHFFQIRDIIPFCGNASVADKVLKLSVGLKWEDEYESRHHHELEIPLVLPHLDIESISTLKSALKSKYSSFRAWAVWQLRRLNYTFTDEEFKLLKNDTNTAVRANLAMAVPEVLLKDFSTDPSPIVQTVILLRMTRN